MLVLGRYRLLARIGRGMNDVWAAWDERTEAEVALKLSRTSCDAEVECMRLVAGHTAGVIDHGTIPGGRAYLAMELLRGLDLDAMVRQGRRVGVPRAVHLMRQACRALAEAHRVGVLHRDVKPGNLHASDRAGEEDRLRVLDFGVASRAVERAEPREYVTGTPAFMAPELFDGEPATAASDVYALGCTFYYAITGVPPFDVEEVDEVCAAHRRAAVIPPSLRVDGVDVPRGVERVILRTLAKRPRDRFADAAAMLASLDAASEDVEPWTAADASAWWQMRSCSISARTSGNLARGAQNRTLPDVHPPRGAPRRVC